MIGKIQNNEKRFECSQNEKKNIYFMSTNIDIELKGTRYEVVTCFIVLLNVPYSRVLLTRKLTFCQKVTVHKD